MKKAINAWCFQEGTSITTIFQSAQQYRYEGVELNVSEDEQGYLHLESTEDQVRNIAKQAASYGVTIPSLSTDLLWKYPLTDPNEEVRQKGEQVVEKMIAFAKLLGAKTVLVVPGIVTEQVSYDLAYERARTAIGSLARVARLHSISIGIENVWNKFLLSPIEMAAFIDEINHPNVGAYFDVGNVLAYGYPEQWIRILNERILAVHVKDFKMSVGTMEGFVPLLSGDIEWNRVKEALHDIGYDGYVIPEIPPHSVHSDILLRTITHSLDGLFNFSSEEEAT